MTQMTPPPPPPPAGGVTTIPPRTVVEPSDVTLTGRAQRGLVAPAAVLPASMAFYRIVAWGTAIIDVILGIYAIGITHGWGDQLAMNFFNTVGSWLASPFENMTAATGQPLELGALLAIFVYTCTGWALAKLFRLNVALTTGRVWKPGLFWR